MIYGPPREPHFLSIIYDAGACFRAGHVVDSGPVQVYNVGARMETEAVEAENSVRFLEGR